MPETLLELKRRAISDIERWIAELQTDSRRDTLSAGILKKAFSHVEDLLRGAAHAFLVSRPDKGEEEVAIASQGKTRTLEKLTLGQLAQLLERLDTRREMGVRVATMRKTDRELLTRIIRARNAFAHGSPRAALDHSDQRELLQDIRRLCDAPVIALASGRNGQ